MAKRVMPSKTNPLEPIEVLEDTASDEFEVLVVNCDSLYLREAADKKGKVVAVLAKGTKLTIVGEQNGWLVVRGTKDYPQGGFVHPVYTRKI
jgi:uncharacterized protein YgiM (DUF1202 family)